MIRCPSLLSSWGVGCSSFGRGSATPGTAPGFGDEPQHLSHTDARLARNFAPHNLGPIVIRSLDLGQPSQTPSHIFAHTTGISCRGSAVHSPKVKSPKDAIVGILQPRKAD